MLDLCTPSSPLDPSRVPPAPRTVYRRTTLGFFWGPAHLGTALLCLLTTAMLLPALAYVLVFAYGQDCPAQLTDTVRSSTRGSHFELATYQYLLEGQLRTSHDLTAPRERSHLYPGATITIRALRVRSTIIDFLPKNPRNAWLAYSDFILAWLALAFASACTFWKFFVLPTRYRRLLRDGDVALARITEKKFKVYDRSYARVGMRRLYGSDEDPDLYAALPDPAGERRTVYTLRYQFTAANGQLHEGRMKVGMGDFYDVRANEEVLVFYDPNHPRKSVIYPFEDDVIAGLEPPDEPRETPAPADLRRAG